MSSWIPKERLTAYQRWELAAFDEQERPAEPPAAPAPPEESPLDVPSVPAPAAALQPPEPAVLLPTAEDIERMHHEAHEAGYTAGYQEGMAAAQAVAMRIRKLMDSLQQALAEIDQDVADQLLALAIGIADQILRQSLRVRPELLLPVVREAITALHPHHGQPLLFVHPDDAPLVRTQLGDQLVPGNWRILEDAEVSAGGCRVELGASEVDATVETRWRRVIEAIGVNAEWLETQDFDTKTKTR